MRRLGFGFACTWVAAVSAGGPVQQAGPNAGSRVATILGDGRILVVTPQGGVRHVRGPSMPPSATVTVGHTLAQSRDGRSVYALVPTRDGGMPRGGSPVTSPGRAALIITELATFAESAVPLPPIARFTALTVAPRTGRLFIAGASDSGVVIVVMSPRGDGRIENVWRVPSSDTLDWRPYQIQLAPDERTLFVSYHGTNTTGINAFAIVGDRVSRCPPGPNPRSGCIDGHGAFVPVGRNRLLLATGAQHLHLVDRRGSVAASIDTKLTGAHVMEFVQDERRIVAIAPCPAGAAVSIVPRGPGGPGGQSGPARLSLGPPHAVTASTATR